MRKFFAVIKREYLQRVRTKFFIVATVLGPLMMALVTVVPVYIAGINVGDATRLAVIDQTGQIYDRFREALGAAEDEDDANSNSGAAANSNQQDRAQRTSELNDARFEVEQVTLDGRSLEEVKRQLNERVRRSDLDGYVVIPPDILAAGKAEFYGRNTGDIFTRGTVADRLSRAYASSASPKTKSISACCGKPAVA